MNKILSLLLLLASCHALFGQDTDPARESADRLAHKYGLDAEDAIKVYAIQVRKQKNLSEVEALAASDPALYRAKLASIQQGTQASIERLLRSPEQRKLYRQTQAEQRLQRAKKRQELEARGATAAEVDAALLGIYLE